jgi:hypothetical protein
MNEEVKPADIKPARKSGRRMPVRVELAGGDDEQRAALQEVLSRIDELDIQFVSGTGAAGGAAGTAKAVILMDGGVKCDRTVPTAGSRPSSR